MQVPSGVSWSRPNPLIPDRSPEDQRNQLRFRLVPLAQFAIRIGSGGIEVAQAYRPQTVGAVFSLYRTSNRGQSIGMGQ
jgi:hypothetical protein